MSLLNLFHRHHLNIVTDNCFFIIIINRILNKLFEITLYQNYLSFLSVFIFISDKINIIFIFLYKFFI